MQMFASPSFRGIQHELLQRMRMYVAYNVMTSKRADCVSLCQSHWLVVGSSRHRRDTTCSQKQPG